MSEDAFRDHLEREVKYGRERIAKSANAMISDLQRLARVAEHGDDPIISEIGELQARGPMFDTACARYATARQLLKDYDAFRREQSDA